MCHGQKSCFFGDCHPTFNRNPCNGYINPYYWVDDHPLLYGNNGSLDPGTYDLVNFTIPYTRKKPPDPETVAQDLDIQVPHTETEVNGVWLVYFLGGSKWHLLSFVGSRSLGNTTFSEHFLYVFLSVPDSHNWRIHHSSPGNCGEALRKMSQVAWNAGVSAPFQTLLFKKRWTGWKVQVFGEISI